mgnify:CR=1 FL=1
MMKTESNFNEKKNSIWKIRKNEEENILSIMSLFNLSYNIASILICRLKISSDISCVEKFLNSNIEDYSASTLKGCTEITNRLMQAFHNQEVVGIFGDYDVDGLSATVLWSEIFEKYNIKYEVYIPNRCDGYGPTPENVQILLDKKVNVLLFVDCGTCCVSWLSKYEVDVCVIDHHVGVADENSIYALVNPYVSTQSEFYDICAVGLSYLIAKQFISRISNDDILSCGVVDLAAYGTIADVMPLVGINRAYVKFGLNKIERLGIRALMELMEKNTLSAGDVAFYIAPILNSAGRISSAMLAYELLFTKDVHVAMQTAKTLFTLNERRKEIESSTVKQALIDRKSLTNKVVCLKSEEWHAGVVGIVAGRVKEIISRPTFVFYKSENLWKGSARSVSQVHIGNLITQSVNLNLAVSGGGHSVAGGVSVDESKFNLWQNWMCENCPTYSDVKTIHVDLCIKLSKISDLCREIKVLSPFGMGNSYPVVLVKHVWLSKADIHMKNESPTGHVRCKIYDGASYIFFAFRCLEDWGGKLLEAEGSYVDLLLQCNERGANIIDVA